MILLMVDLRVVDISGFDVILDMDELTAIELSVIMTLGRLSYPTRSWICVRLYMHVSDAYVHGILGRNSFKGGECETPRKSNFPKNGKMAISVKIRNFSRSRMTKWTSPLESSREI